LQFECTNNTTKYEACIVNLQAALKLEVEKFDVYRDSILPGEGEMTN
jgi:ribonuclease HI